MSLDSQLPPQLETTKDISEYANSMQPPCTAAKLSNFYLLVKNRLNTSAGSIFAGAAGTKVNVIVESLSKEYINLSRDTFLEKYLISNDSPKIKLSAPVDNYHQHKNLRSEMWWMFNIAGVYNTVLFYSLLIYHLEA